MANEPDFYNQRRKPRVRMATPARAVIKSEGGLVNKGKGLALEWSEGGAQLYSAQVVKYGERLLVEFTLPSGEVFDIRGKVRWVVVESMGCRFGMEFENLTASRLKNLQELTTALPIPVTPPPADGLAPKRHLRVKMAAPAYVDVKSEGGLVNKGRGVLLDASLGGALLQATQEIRAGERLMLEFPLPVGKGTFDIRGKVKWVVREAMVWRFGVEFENLSPTRFENLQALLGQKL